MTLREDVVRAIDHYSSQIYSLLEYGKTSENQHALTNAADAAITIVLDRVKRELSAVQYDPAPYTAMKYRLRKLSEESLGKQPTP